MHFASLTGISVTLSLISSVVGHACPWHPSMFGFNFTGNDNPPQYPLQQRDFSGETGWWFHGHLDYPPHPEDVLEFPAGGETFVEITCDKAATSYFKTGTGTDLRDGDKVCPGATSLEFHTTGIDDVKGCAFAIAYTPASKASSLQPEDFVVFSVNQTCVWERFTKFEVPPDMPACPEGGCTCAWFWIHSADAGSEQMYMNAYQCDITGAKSTVPLAKPQVPRRCGADSDPELVKPFDAQNCTYGAKQPLYWFQKQNNNMFEGSHAPPFYNDLYGFKDGAQNDIFVNSQLPSMNWPGAPLTGQLDAVAGIFSGGSGIIPNAQSSSSSSQQSAPSSTPSSDPSSQQTTPSSTPGGDSSESSSAPAATPTSKEVSPNNVESAPSSSSDPATPTSSSSGSSESSPAHAHKKTCKKHKHKAKRSIANILSHHKRQSFRKHH